MASSIKKSQAQERRGAQKFGGSVRPGSGSKWFAKGDVSTSDRLIEYKITDKKSFSLKLEELLKIRKEALLEDKTPVFGVSFGGQHHFIVLDEADYETLYLEANGTQP